MTGDFLSRLKDPAAILFDGAMGTMLYQRGFYLNSCFDELNVSAPDVVRKIHQDYIRAGAEVIETNTFGANRNKLTPHGFGDRVAEFCEASCRLAREAAGEDAFVAGAISPLGAQIEPWGPMSLQEARDTFREQAEVLRDGGVDLFILETFGNLGEMQQAILAVSDCSDLPIVAQMTVDSQGNSLYGATPELFGSQLDQWGAHVVGINCSVGPRDALDVIERVAAVTDKPLSVQPNAGVPRDVDGRNIYLVSPEYLAEYTRRFVRAGAKIVGGCCGTTPDHTRVQRSTLRLVNADSSACAERVRVEVQEHNEHEQPEVPLAERSHLGARLAAGEFVTTVELSPPKGHDPAKLVKRARKLKEAGVDAVNVPDGPRATARMSAMAAALLIEQQAGIEAILHYTCRDRNLIGMQSDLLGASALGLRNLLLLTGDPPKLGDYPDATAVFDIDSIGLNHMARRLNHGLDLGPGHIGSPTSFCFGVGVDPGAVDLEYELGRFRHKLEAGAQFATTQPVFDVSILERFLERVGDVDIPIIAGVWPLLSFRNAEFMNNEVPGAHVPEDILDRMYQADAKGGGREEGLLIAREIFERVRPNVQGVQVSAPGGRVKLALEVFGSALDR